MTEEELTENENDLDSRIKAYEKKRAEWEAQKAIWRERRRIGNANKSAEKSRLRKLVADNDDLPINKLKKVCYNCKFFQRGQLKKTELYIKRNCSYHGKLTLLYGHCPHWEANTYVLTSTLIKLYGLER